jgi:hypothetical protein
LLDIRVFHLCSNLFEVKLSFKIVFKFIFLGGRTNLHKKIQQQGTAK